VNPPTIRAQFSLDSISVLVTAQTLVGGYYQQPAAPIPVPDRGLYMWTVFFKIDGDTVSVDGDLQLQGTATVIGTSGDQGDLPAISGTQAGPVVVAIPAAIGKLSAVLTPIPLTTIPGVTIPGAMGCIAIVLAKNGTPADAVAQGHAALNSSLESALDSLITTLSIKSPDVTDADVQAMTTAVTTAVEGAIKGALSIWDKLGTVAGTTTQDEIVGSALYQFAVSDLVASPPAGIALGNGYPTTAPLQYSFFASEGGSPDTLACTLQGVMTADPIPVSLKRVLTRLGQTSTRQAMAGSPSDSVTAWVDAIT
jgi:surface antigen